MDHIKLKAELLKLEKKLSKNEFNKELVSELISLSEKKDRVALEFKIKEYAKHHQAIISQTTSDKELTALEEEIKRVSSPYKEQKKENNLKTRFVGLLLQELNNFQE